MATEIIRFSKGFKTDKIYIHKPLPAIADLDAIEDFVQEAKENANCSVGTNYLTFTAVPSGKIRLITNILAIAILGNPNYVRIDRVANSNEYWIRRKDNPGVGTEVLYNRLVILNAGDYVQVVFSSMASGDVIYAYIVGYQVSKY